MQSKKHSLLEACLNTASGFIISLMTGHFVFPAFNCNVTFSQNVAMTLIFTVISIVRSYAWRRFFNNKVR